MKISHIMTTAFAATASIVAAGFADIVTAPPASADQSADASSRGLGSQGTLVNGDVIQGWTVSDLKPSGDAIPYPVQGTLWEATATDEAIKGNVVPIVPNLGARAPSGQAYRALYQVATPQGVNPAALAQGQKTTGKIYFDVTGDSPDTVVYTTGGHDLASWVETQPPQPRSGSGARTTSGGHPATTPPLPATAAPGSGQQTPVVNPVIPASTPSQGTRPSGSQGTPIPANGPALPAPQVSPAAPAGGQVAPGESPAAPAPQVSPAPPAPEVGQVAPGENPAPVVPEISPAPTSPATVPLSPAGGPALPTPAAGPALPTLAAGPGVPPGNTSTPTPGLSTATPAPARGQGSAGSPATTP